jgi:hypothetical protein
MRSFNVTDLEELIYFVFGITTGVVLHSVFFI